MQNLQENITGLEGKSSNDILFTLRGAIAYRRANNIDESNIIKLIDVYLALNGMNLQNVELLSKIAYSIRLQSDLVDINSVSKALIDWGIENEIIQLKNDFVRHAKEYSLSMLVNPTELIVLLQVNHSNILYLSSSGSVKMENWSAFSNRWPRLILTSKPTPISKIKLNSRPTTSLNLLKGYNSFYDKGVAIVSRGIYNSDGIIYHMLVVTTTPIVYFLYKLRLKPLPLCLAWIILRYTAGIIIFYNQTTLYRIIAAFLLLLSYTLEVCQTTLEKFSMQESQLNSHLVKLGSLTSRLLIIACISMGLYDAENSEFILLWGGACILSDILFYSAWENRLKTLLEERNVIINFIALLHPLNPNVFIFGLLFNKLFFSIELWTVLGLALALLVVFMDLLHLIKTTNKRSVIYKNYTTENLPKSEPLITT